MITPSLLKNVYFNCLRLNSLHSLSYKLSDFTCVQKYIGIFKENVLICCFVFFLSCFVKLCPTIVVKPWNRLPMAVMESLSLEVLKRHVDGHLGTWFSGEVYSGGLMIGLNDLKAPFQNKWFYVSIFFSFFCWRKSIFHIPSPYPAFLLEQNTDVIVHVQKAGKNPKTYNLASKNIKWAYMGHTEQNKPPVN